MIKEPVCFNCKHFKPKGKNDFSCSAFPKGIPDAILYGKNDHTSKFAGQVGDDVFEPVKETVS